jgi:uncharacterized protein YbjQ (UPF0145 family)
VSGEAISMLAVTIDTLPGFEIKTVIGEVVGVTIRPWNAYTEGIKALSGVMNPRMQHVLARLREEAIARMVERAHRRGANAIVGMRFDHRTVSDGWAEICAYGTAVLVVPAAKGGSRRSRSTGSARQP